MTAPTIVIYPCCPSRERERESERERERERERESPNDIITDVKVHYSDLYVSGKEAMLMMYSSLLVVYPNPVYLYYS